MIEVKGVGRVPSLEALEDTLGRPVAVVSSQRPNNIYFARRPDVWTLDTRFFRKR